MGRERTIDEREEVNMESWRKVFREGLAPLLDDDELEILKGALERDDPTLIQGATTNPPPLICMQDWPVEGACPISYMHWKTGLDTVGGVEEAFAQTCFEIDKRLNEPSGCRWFINWVDDSPRKVVIRELLAEVVTELERRQGKEEVACERQAS